MPHELPDCCAGFGLLQGSEFAWAKPALPSVSAISAELIKWYFTKQVLDLPKGCIFIDESGDPGLSKRSRSEYFVFGFVYCEDPSMLQKKLKRYLKRLHQRGKYPEQLRELKFYLPYSYLTKRGHTIQELDDKYSVHMPEIRSNVLNIIREHSDRIFASAIDKRALKSKNDWPPDRLGNFMCAQTIINDILNKIMPPTLPVIYCDEGRLSALGMIEFNAYLIEQDKYHQYKRRKRYSGNLTGASARSSVSETGIWAADMVAGAFYHKFANSDAAYSNILNPRKIGDGAKIFRL